MSNSSIWPTDRILSVAITSSQSGSESDGNEGALYISQSYGITGASPSDYFVSYPRQSSKCRLKIKESEKIDKYLDLARELKELWNMKMTVIPVVAGVLGTAPRNLETRLSKCEKELKPSRSQLGENQLEYFGESWRSEDTCYYSCWKPPVRADRKNTQKVN